MSFLHSWQNSFRAILAAVIPPRRTETALARLSQEKLRPLIHASPAQEVRHLLPYRNEDVRALVWELKYHAHPKAARLAADLLAEEIVGILSEELGGALLIPIPMHKKRRRERGFNQTEILCEGIMALNPQLNTLRYAPNMLARIRESAPQQSLPRNKRLKNMDHSLHADSAVYGRTCFVIDDVATTGATLREARRALMASGAKKVYLLALAG